MLHFDESHLLSKFNKEEGAKLLKIFPNLSLDFMETTTIVFINKLQNPLITKTADLSSPMMTVDKNRIVVFKDFCDKLTYQEKKALIYHEIGHYKPVDKSFVRKRVFDRMNKKYTLREYREDYKEEITSDLFSCFYFNPVYLYSALGKMINDQRFDTLKDDMKKRKQIISRAYPLKIFLYRMWKKII